MIMVSFDIANPGVDQVHLKVLVTTSFLLAFRTGIFYALPQLRTVQAVAHDRWL